MQYVYWNACRDGHNSLVEEFLMNEGADPNYSCEVWLASAGNSARVLQSSVNFTGFGKADSVDVCR